MLSDPRTCSRSEGPLRLDASQLCEHLVDDEEVMLGQSHCARSRQELVAHGDGWQWDVKLPSHLQRQQHILLHHVDIEPGFIWLIEDKWGAVLERRRGYHAVKQDFQRRRARNAAFFREEQRL